MNVGCEARMGGKSKAASVGRLFHANSCAPLSGKPHEGAALVYPKPAVLRRPIFYVIPSQAGDGRTDPSIDGSPRLPLASCWRVRGRLNRERGRPAYF